MLREAFGGALYKSSDPRTKKAGREGKSTLRRPKDFLATVKSYAHEPTKRKGI